MAVHEFEHLAQQQGTTSAASILSGRTDRRVTVLRVDVTRIGPTGKEAFVMYMDQDGTTYDNTTVILKGSIASAEDQHSFAVFWTLSQAAGSIGVLASTASMLNFNLHGQVTD